MRVVLDTNVVISATLIRGGNEDRILRAWQHGAFELVLSPEILDELGRALFYEKLRKFRWMNEGDVALLLQLLTQESVFVPGKVRITASRDPEDDKFLAAAVEGKAAYVVTGDKDLLSLKHYRGARIITPTAFLKVLKERTEQ
jgi:putative PIN family toxin of toxin-antitoxin system